MKRTLLYIALLVASGSGLKAQYLPNYGFEAWKTACGNSYQSSTGALFGGKSPEGERQRPGQEPEGWNGSSVNQKVMSVTKSEVLVSASTATPDGSQAVRLENKYVGAAGIGSNAPAFITLATPWVYAVSSIANCDGGVYGGSAFSHRPDAIRGRFRRPATDKGEKAHIIAYLWKGTFKSTIPATGSALERDNVDRVIMGRAEATQRGQLVASCDHEFAATAGDGWEEITVPLTYEAGQEEAVPEMMNVIISGADYWTRGNIQAGSVLEVDDLQFVYYSELASFSFSGTAYTPQAGGSVSIDAPYDATAVSYTLRGIGASASSSYDADSRTLTIVVTGNDAAATPSNRHTYRFVFDEEGGGTTGPIDPVEPVEPVDPVDPSQPGLGEVVTDLGATVPEKTYVLFNAHFNAYAIYAPAHSSGYVWTAAMHGDDSHTLANGSYSEPFDATTPAGSWMLIPSGEGYALYNVGARKYLSVPTGNTGGSSLFTTFSDEPVELTFLPLSEGNYALTAGTAEHDYLCAAPQAAAPLATWESSDAGAAWQLIENPNVEPDADLLASIVKPLGEPVGHMEETSIAKTYVLYNEHFTAYAVYDAAESETNVWTAAMTGDDDHPLASETYSKALQPKQPGSSWMIIPRDGGYCLYNMGAGKFLATPAYEGSTTPCTFSDEPVIHTAVELGDNNFAFTAAGHAQDYLCAAPQAGSPLSIWRLTDAGAAWQLRENPNVAADEELGYIVSSIAQATTATAPRGIYTLQGLRLNVTSTGQLPAGIYIVDGRKVIVGNRR